MIIRIAVNECRIIWRDHRFRWAGGMLWLLAIVAMLVGFQIYGRRTAAIDAAHHEQRDQWLHRSMSNPHVAAHSGITLFRPLHPLAVLDNGVDDLVGTSIFLEPHRRSLFAQSAAERSSVVGQFAELTAAFTLQALVPLLIVLLTFPAFAAEREQGTLRYLLSAGVRPRDLVLGKALGLIAPVLLLTVPAMLIGLAALQARQALDLSRGALMVLGYLLSLSIFGGVGLLVSARARSTQGALIALLGLWLIGCFLLPRAAFALAQRVHPAPTAREFVAALQRIDEAEAGGFMQQRVAIERRLLAQHGVAKPTDLPVSTWGATLYEREISSTRRYNEQFARMFDAYERQQRLVDVISIAVPPLALRTVSMALAGTDTAHYRHFAEAAETYRYELIQTMNRIAMESRLFNSSPTLAGPPERAAFPGGQEMAYKRVGPFEYRQPGAWWALTRASTPAAALLAWCLGLGVFVTRASRDLRID
jgi:ABC-2 type transport system permease protein